MKSWQAEQQVDAVGHPRYGCKVRESGRTAGVKDTGRGLAGSKAGDILAVGGAATGLVRGDGSKGLAEEETGKRGYHKRGRLGAIQGDLVTGKSKKFKNGDSAKFHDKQ